MASKRLQLPEGASQLGGSRWLRHRIKGRRLKRPRAQRTSQHPVARYATRKILKQDTSKALAMLTQFMPPELS